MLLDSHHARQGSRYCIFSASPKAHVIGEIKEETDNASDLLTKMQDFVSQYQRLVIPENYNHLPFVCGLMGYCSYRSGEALHKLVLTDQAGLDACFPDIFIGNYTWSYVHDRHTDSGVLTFSPECHSELRKEILALIEHSESHSFEQNVPTSKLYWKKSQDPASYKQAFTSVQRYIHAGDCYQVNLTQRFECELIDQPPAFNAFAYYLHKQYALQTPYSAYISFAPEQKLMSFSPEQFIQIRHRVIESKPIKGTIANTSDQGNIERLKDSAKNKAENVMIVDLLRNDLSKVCEVNSVEVPELFKIESFKNVHHMVSHIRGKLREGISEFDAFLSCFPGGSITGAPKLRAMEIIHELEKHNRRAYCGSVFYCNDNGHFDSNILIRTVIQSGKKLYCWAGGGIVADSEAEDEYLESLTKVANLTGIND